MAKNRIRTMLVHANRELRRKKYVSIVYLALRLSVILVMVAQFFNRNFQNAFLCLMTLVLFLLPTLFEQHLHIELPNTLEIIILLFIYSAEILGEIRSFYTMFPFWDTTLHTLNGFLCAAIGFCLVDMFNRNERFSLSLSPAFMAIVAFCFSMTIGVLWEFFELFMDQIFLTDMQKDTVVDTLSSVLLNPAGGSTAEILRNVTEVTVVSGGESVSLDVGGYLDIGLLDTMMDMFVNFVGALIFSMIGFFYVRSRGSGRFARRFIPQVLDLESGSAADGQESPSAPKNDTSQE